MRCAVVHCVTVCDAMTLAGDDHVQVRWSDGHTSVFSREWIMKHAPQEGSEIERPSRSTPRRVLTAHSTLPEVRRCSGSGLLPHRASSVESD